MFRSSISAIVFIFLFSLSGIAGAQTKSGGQPQENLPRDMEHAFEKAMRTVDKEKAAEERAFKEKLKEELKSASADWLAQARTAKQAEYNKLVGQNWEDLRQAGPWFHYDYFLRGCDYREVSVDVVKTDSLVIPYKGYLKAQEFLFVERKHLPNFDTKQYLYTATTPMTVAFDYKDNRFMLAQVKKENPVIKQGWPAQAAAKPSLE